MNLFSSLAHLLTPRSSNNHKAGILHPAPLALLVALFLIIQFSVNIFAVLRPAVLGFASNITPEKVIELTNQKRAELGLQPLSNNNLLNEAAQRKAGDMFAFNYWAHTSPSGRDPWTFFKEVSYRYLYAGENLARDFMDSQGVVDAWMNSPTHKDNIVNPHYSEIGLAVVNGTLNGVETTLVVQLFGTPAIAQVAKSVAVAQEEPAPLPLPRLGEASSYALLPSREETSSPPIFSPFLMTKTLAIFLLGIILGVLVLDVILVWQRKIVRLSGKNLAHLLYIMTLLLAIILTTPGAIL